MNPLCYYYLMDPCMWLLLEGYDICMLYYILCWSCMHVAIIFYVDHVCMLRLYSMLIMYVNMVKLEIVC